MYWSYYGITESLRIKNEWIPIASSKKFMVRRNKDNWIWAGGLFRNLQHTVLCQKEFSVSHCALDAS